MAGIQQVEDGRHRDRDAVYRRFRSTTQALGQTRVAVDELSRMAADLRTTVGRFSW